ncbi:MAG: hypothetical protein ABI896_03685 [Actinomycetota bacterium]
MAALLLGTLALALAWLTFRIERFGARQREIQSARALLIAVNEALVSRGKGEEMHPGWGETYFGLVYTPERIEEAGERARHQAQMGVFDQVFVVPTEPLEKLATTDRVPDLISIETVSAANFGLWRVGVFNQLVLQQTVFNAVTHLELRDAETTDDRKKAIGQSAKHISQTLHLYGVAGAAAPAGWYSRLKNGIAADISRLAEMDKKTLGRWKNGPEFAIIDLAVIAGLLGVVIFTIFCGL